jgi:tetratricopeptide (TPR) repeat protein
MGASTYNDELKKELDFLDKIIKKQINPKIYNKIKDSLLKGNAAPYPKGCDEAYIREIFLALPELFHEKETLSETKKLWLKAKLLFLRRRFIEAATVMSEVLKKEPGMIIAQNWQARAFFFLGNPDLALRKLQTIVEENPPRSEAHLDALYLIGAIVYESQDLNKKRLQKGIAAWMSYMRLAEIEPKLKEELNLSIKELRSRFEHEELDIEKQDIFVAHKNYSAEKNSILESFNAESLLLAEKLCEQELTKKYDRDIALIKARIYIKTGRIDQACLLFDDIIKRDKLYVEAFHYRGMAFMMKGEIKEAISSWQDAQKLNPRYAEQHNLSQRISVAQKMIAEH